MNRVLCVLFFVAYLCPSALANDSPQALQETFMSALRANDAQGLADCYTADAVNFAVDSLVGIGPESVRESWLRFFADYKVVKASLSDTHMESHGDTAVAWGLFTLLVEPAKGGDALEMKGRYMDVARYIDGTWLYVADHASMPLPTSEPEG